MFSRSTSSLSHPRSYVDLYPDLTPKQREYEIVKLHGAVFIEQIGGKLKSGEPHDGRAPDYDDWKLNGDIIVYYPVLDIALELSSMGIRVDEISLHEQLKAAGCEEREKLAFRRVLLHDFSRIHHRRGIGQSCIRMFFKESPYRQIQSSLWPDEVREEAKKAGIPLL